MNITYDQALELFDEANRYDTGAQLYIDEESKIRRIAQETFGGNGTISTLNVVCREIFRVIAERHVHEVNQDLVCASCGDVNRRPMHGG